MRAWVTAWLDRMFLRGLRAAVEGLYPPSHNGAPDGVATDLAARTEAHVRKLPTSVRVQVMAMFVAIELLPLLVAPWRGRFSARSPSERVAMIGRWRASWLDPFRLLATGLHAQLQMIYLSHPAVSAFIGEYKPVAYPDDTYPMAIRPLPPIDGGAP